MATPRLCRANAGTREEPRECAKPIAKGMLAACADHRTTLIPTGTPGIYARGGSYVTITRQRGKQIKSFHRTLAEAREAKGDRTGSSKQAPQTRRPFDAYARDWVRNCQGRTRRGFDDDTRAAYAMALKGYAIPHLGSTPLRDIDREAVNALVAKMQRQGLAPASVMKYIAPLRALLSDAVGNGHLAANPALRLAINAKATQREDDELERIKDMTRAELVAVLAAVPEGRDRLFFELLAGTGARISEALGLDWPDLANHNGRFTLAISKQWYRGRAKPYTKSANGQRTISLSPELGRKLWDRGADATGPMFATRSGKRLSARNQARVLERAAGKAGLRISPHSFRHTHGSMLLNANWPITDVAHRLGDDVQTVAKTYAHKLRDSHRDLGFLDELGNAWATQDPETAANPVSPESDKIHF
jgi:integrase